jgi:predicted lipoprotein with Yx(FWY)xxD motif
MFGRTVLIGVCALAVAAAVAGCGGGGGSSTPTTTTGQTGSAKNPGTMFSTAKVQGVGTVLVDGKGRTVYILTANGKTNVPCNDPSGCTAVWPDLPLPDGTSKPTAGTGVDAMLFGTKKIGDETYPTYNGWLMYEYTGDSGPGQANGQGIKSFGGTWYVLNAKGDPVTSSSGGSGGGYP